MTTAAQSTKIRSLYNEARKAGLLVEGPGGKVLTEGIFPALPMAASLKFHESRMDTKQASAAIDALTTLLRAAQKPNDDLAAFTDVQLINELTSRLTDRQLAALIGQHTNLKIED